jgi:lipoprotein NlpD
MKRLSHIAVISLTGLWLAGCSNNNEPTSGNASISSVNGGMSSSRSASPLMNSPTSGSGGMLASKPVSSERMLSPTNTRPSQPPVASPVVSAPVHHNAVMPEPQETAVVGPDGRVVYKRSYANIPRGSYTGTTYQVRRGDTLFYIAWVTGNDFRDLAARNHIDAPYGLKLGQVLNVNNDSANQSAGGEVIANQPQSQPHQPVVSPGAIQSTTVVATQPTTTYSETSGNENAGKMLPSSGVTTASVPHTAPGNTVPTATSNAAPITAWKWPTDGKIIDNFSSSDGGNKGIDIAGSRGQPIVATASGRVVYAGNALRGYGNLIIIKHNDDYLSAYAHNDTMLVREQQEVQAGQQIATMGSTGTSSVRLHFEIRYKGKSVNPLRFLGQR